MNINLPIGGFFQLVCNFSSIFKSSTPLEIIPLLKSCNFLLYMDYLIFTDDLVPYVGTSFMLNRGTFFIVPIHTLFIEISEFEIATKEAIILKPQGEIWICGVLSRCFLNGKPKTNTGLLLISHIHKKLIFFTPFL